MNDNRQVINVNTTSRNVSSDENLDLSGLDRTQGALALRLAAVTVEGYCRESALAELLSQTVSAVLSASKDNGLAVLFDYLSTEVGLLVARDAPEEVINITRGFFANYVVGDGVLGELLNQRANIGAHRGGEQHDVTGFCSGAHNATHRRHESHVGHAVGLVDGNGGALTKVKGSLLEHVLKTAGAGDNNVDASGEGLAGGVVAGATVDGQDATALVLGELSQFLLHLGRQLTGGDQDQGVGLARTSGLGASQEGQAEGEGLTRAGSGLSDYVESLEGIGDADLLDGEGGFDTT